MEALYTKMQPCKVVRCISSRSNDHSPYFFVDDSKEIWLDRVKRLEDTTDTGVKVAVIDPFDQTITPSIIECKLFKKKHVDGSWSIIFSPDKECLERLISRSADVSNTNTMEQQPYIMDMTPVAENLSDGEYIGCMVQRWKSEKLPKQPGFTIWGRPFVGKAVIMRGGEFMCPPDTAAPNQRRRKQPHLLDVWKDFEWLEPSAEVNDHADFRWLNAKEAIAARVAFYESTLPSVTNELSEIRADGGTSIILGQSGVTPSDSLATCWGCGKDSAARKKCSGCMRAYYCDTECQQKHWNEGHKFACGR
jgi:hypothetical protein